jgi:hypothetical protein
MKGNFGRDSAFSPRIAAKAEAIEGIIGRLSGNKPAGNPANEVDETWPQSGQSVVNEAGGK